MVFFHVLHKLHQIHLVGIYIRIDGGSGLDFQNTFTVESVTVAADITVDNPVRDKLSVVHQIDMIPDKRLNVVSVSGIGVAFKGILCKSSLFQKQLPSGFELGNTADNKITILTTYTALLKIDKIKEMKKCF